MESRVVLFEQIRRESRVEGLSVRALAARHGVHRRTVRQALASAVPPERAPRRWQARKLDPYVAAIDAMLRSDLDAPRKQRHTARRILSRLVEEHAATGVAYSTVSAYVSFRRAEIMAEAGRTVNEVLVPQTHPPGAEAEVDFAELFVDLPAGRVKCYLFTLRLCFSGRAVHRVFATQSQEAFLEGHIAAFTELGGVPTGQVKFDNLKSAVTTILLGTDRRRTENERKNSVAIASNESFSGWTKTFVDPRLCAAIVDRLPLTARLSRPAPSPTALPTPSPLKERSAERNDEPNQG